MAVGPEHIGNTLKGFGKILCPPFFKGLPGHDAVMDRKIPQQKCVDGESLPDWNPWLTIHGVGEAKDSQKAHGIKKIPKKDR